MDTPTDHIEILDHIHMIGTAYVTKPPMTAEAGTQWLTELVEKVGMKVLVPAKAVYCDTPGNRGVTGIVCLETSHASFHSWHEAERPFISLDLYSCRRFEAETIVEHLSQFGLVELDYILVDRNNGTNVIKQHIHKE